MVRGLSKFREGAGPLVCAGPTLVPTLSELEFLLRAVGRRHAPGLDGLPGELYASVPDLVARLLHPLLVKIGVRFQEPVSYKGGRAAELYKGRGRIPDCSSYREVLVANEAAKCWHRHVRGRLAPFAEGFALDVVCCARHRGADVGAHGPRALQEWARERGVCVAMLFVDVKAAYYSLVRGLAFGPDVCDEELAVLLGRLGMEPSALNDLLGHLAEQPALVQAGVPEDLQQAAAEALTGTWFMVSGAARIARGRCGTRPGDPLADIIFGFVMTRIRKRIREALRAEGLVETVHWSGVRDLGGLGGAGMEVDVADFLYADDDAFPVVGPAAEIIPRVRKAACIVSDVVGGFGLRVNFKRRKTEALVALRGVGSKALLQ